MYVAATRAAFWLGCSGYWWGEGASRSGRRRSWTRSGGPARPAPAGSTTGRRHPSRTRSTRRWPSPPRPAGPRPPPGSVTRRSGRAPTWSLAAAQDARAAETQETQETKAGQEPRTRSKETNDTEDPAALSEEDQALVAAWQRDAELLLAERERRRADGGLRVVLPGHLSVSSLVTLARDPAELARQVRRPMPRPPAPYARRGTAFHQLAGGALRPAAADRHRRPVRRATTCSVSRDRRPGPKPRPRPTWPSCASSSRPASGPAGGRARSRCRSRR